MSKGVSYGSMDLKVNISAVLIHSEHLPCSHIAWQEGSGSLSADHFLWNIPSEMAQVKPTMENVNAFH